MSGHIGQGSGLLPHLTIFFFWKVKPIKSISTFRIQEKGKKQTLSPTQATREEASLWSVSTVNLFPWPPLSFGQLQDKLRGNSGVPNYHSLAWPPLFTPAKSKTERIKSFLDSNLWITETQSLFKMPMRVLLIKTNSAKLNKSNN